MVIKAVMGKGFYQSTLFDAISERYLYKAVTYLVSHAG
jgi:hypothetical protein